MLPGTYLTFLTMAVIVVLIPGPDFAVVARNTLVGGRARGWATAAAGSSVCAASAGCARKSGIAEAGNGAGSGCTAAPNRAPGGVNSRRAEGRTGA